MLGRGRWFFLQISRRRRIGKARLLQELLQDHADSVKPGIGSQVAGHLETLAEKWELVVQRLSVFAMPKARKRRYTIRDTFPRCWLDALAVPAAAINFRPLEGLVEQAD
jgi:hypothetical protein